MAAAQRLFKQYAFHVFDRMKHDFWPQVRASTPSRDTYGFRTFGNMKYAQLELEFSIKFDGPHLIITKIQNVNDGNTVDVSYKITLCNEKDKYSFYGPGSYIIDNKRLYGDDGEKKDVTILDGIAMDELILYKTTEPCAIELSHFCEWLHTVDILEMDMANYGHFYLHVYEKIVWDKYRRACLCSKIARRVQGEYLVMALVGTYRSYMN